MCSSKFTTKSNKQGFRMVHGFEKKSIFCRICVHFLCLFTLVHNIAIIRTFFPKDKTVSLFSDNFGLDRVGFVVQND